MLGLPQLSRRLLFRLWDTSNGEGESWDRLYCRCRCCPRASGEADAPEGRSELCLRLLLCLHNSTHRLESKLRTSPGGLLPSRPWLWFPLTAGLSPRGHSEAFLENSAFSRLSAQFVVSKTWWRQLDRAKNHRDAAIGQEPGQIFPPTDTPAQTLYCPGFESGFTLLVTIDALRVCSRMGMLAIKTIIVSQKHD